MQQRYASTFDGMQKINWRTTMVRQSLLIQGARYN